MTTDAKNVTEDGTMAFLAPSTFDMKMSVLGQGFELLVIAPDEYLNLGKGWYSLGDALVNRDAYAEYAKNRGPVDYVGIVNALQQPQELPDDQIDGKTYLHYSGTFDLNDAIGKVPQDVFKPGVTGLVTQLGLQPANFEVWLDPDTSLPRRAALDMTMQIAASPISTKMVIDYVSWNEAVDIPPAPQDAKPYSELTGGLTPADLSYVLQYSNWLGTFAKHLSSFDTLPTSASAQLTPEQRATAQALVDNFSADLNAVQAFQPTPRFQPSYDMTMNAMRSFKIVFDEAEKDLQHPGEGDEQRANDAADQGGNLFKEATKLFQSELPAKQ